MFDIKPKEQQPEQGQVKVFREIWNERPHESEVSGEPLPYNFGPGMFFVFSHVLSKGACPQLKLDKRYIILMTIEEHEEWEFRGFNCTEPKWEPVWELLEQARQICNQFKDPKPLEQCRCCHDWWPPAGITPGGLCNGCAEEKI